MTQNRLLEAGQHCEEGPALTLLTMPHMWVTYVNGSQLSTISVFFFQAS